MHAISSYRGNRPTNKQTHTHINPQTGPITIHCAAALLARSVNIINRASSKNIEKCKLSECLNSLKNANNIVYWPSLWYCSYGSEERCSTPTAELFVLGIHSRLAARFRKFFHHCPRKSFTNEKSELRAIAIASYSAQCNKKGNARWQSSLMIRAVEQCGCFCMSCRLAGTLSVIAVSCR